MRENRIQRTALVLSGGGSRGAYQAGVWQALKELDVRIDMVFGTSVGAINGAMIAQDEFDLTIRLWKELETSMLFAIDVEAQRPPTGAAGPAGITLEEAAAYAREILLSGGADTSGLREILRHYVEENKLRAAAMDYGLVTVEMPGFEAHRLYKADIPPGKMMDYILASASCFPAAKAHVIDGISYVDGGYADNLPVSMALKSGAERIIAVNLQAVGYVRKEDLQQAEKKRFTLLESAWDLGNFLVFDRENSTRNLRLGYLETMKAFGVFDGERYTFIKGVFDARELKLADAAADSFELSPLYLFSRESLDDRLADAVAAARRNRRREIKIDRSVFKSRRAFLAILKEVTKKFSDQSLVLLIAEHLKESPGRDNLFLSRPAKKLFPKQIAAARYLLKNGLL